MQKNRTKLTSIRGGISDLKKVVKNGVAFHHAGMLSNERKIVEESFRKHLLKVIICTTTLSAGINLPARVVVLRDFKKYSTSGRNVRNFERFHEDSDGFSFFLPFSGNEVFQMLGRAGRPGFDSEGHGVILVSDVNELNWVQDNYFTNNNPKLPLQPRYNNLDSGLNDINTLKEQTLLRVYEEGDISSRDLVSFFKKTFFWYCMKGKMGQDAVPIEQLLMIEEITPENLIKLHANPKIITKVKNKSYAIKLANFTKTSIGGYVKTDYGVQSVKFDIEKGILCSCGFENGMSDGYASPKFSFEFCEHVTALLIHLLEIPDPSFKKHVDDVIPQCLRAQYILNYLFEKGLLLKNEDNTLRCSAFGKLIIRLYLYPISGVLIRSKLERFEINSFQDMVREAYEVVRAERRVRDYKLLQPLIEWIDEEPVESILEKYHIMAGDLYGLKENIERIITFMGIIAVHLAETGFEMQDTLVKVAEMAETLKIRVHYGIREELFDLVLRLPNVARVRARILFDAGYKTATQVKKERISILHRKTGMGVKLCKNIIMD